MESKVRSGFGLGRLLPYLLIPVLCAVGFLKIRTNPPRRPALSLDEAVRRGDAESIRRHQKLGTDLDAQDALGRTPLHLAIHEGSAAAVEGLLAAGADINRTDRTGRTPLHAAIFEGNLHLVELLLKAAPQVDAPDGWKFSPLHAAVTMTFRRSVTEPETHALPPAGALPEGATHAIDRALVELLLRYGASVNARTRDGRTPLHMAVRSLPADVVALLLDYGADVHALDNYERTPLDWALFDDNRAVVELLLLRGASPTALPTEPPALHASVATGGAASAIVEG